METNFQSSIQLKSYRLLHENTQNECPSSIYESNTCVKNESNSMCVFFSSFTFCVLSLPLSFDLYFIRLFLTQHNHHTWIPNEHSPLWTFCISLTKGSKLLESKKYKKRRKKKHEKKQVKTPKRKKNEVENNQLTEKFVQVHINGHTHTHTHTHMVRSFIRCRNVCLFASKSNRTIQTMKKTELNLLD